MAKYERQFHVHFDSETQKFLDKAKDRTGASWAELIRRAVKKVYGEKKK